MVKGNSHFAPNQTGTHVLQLIQDVIIKETPLLQFSVIIIIPVLRVLNKILFH